MNLEQLERMKNGKGFIAALDQSGGSTPKALKQYGIDETAYQSEEEMLDLVHAMRTRVIRSGAFSRSRILAAILFENTMDRTIDGMDTADYLWEVKGIIPLLKVDQGLAPLENGVQLMKPIPHLDELLAKAKAKHIFGTKMRSVIKECSEEGIRAVVDQQFEIGLRICEAGLVPILEPEVDINCPEKAQAEELLKANILKHLEALPQQTLLMFKLTIPTEDNFYRELIEDPRVVRVVALSGGYSQALANEKLSRNHGMIASFSRAFLVGLNAAQSDEEFDAVLRASADSICEASAA